MRLLTLTGAAGIGKTRLALQIAGELVEHFTDGVFFVALAPIVDPSLILATIAQTLDIREVGGHPLVEDVREQLRAKELLLLLDNFEHLLAVPAHSGQICESRGRSVEGSFVAGGKPHDSARPWQPRSDCRIA